MEWLLRACYIGEDCAACPGHRHAAAATRREALNERGKHRGGEQRLCVDDNRAVRGRHLRSIGVYIRHITGYAPGQGRSQDRRAGTAHKAGGSLTATMHLHASCMAALTLMSAPIVQCLPCQAGPSRVANTPPPADAATGTPAEASAAIAVVAAAAAVPSPPPASPSSALPRVDLPRPCAPMMPMMQNPCWCPSARSCAKGIGRVGREGENRYERSVRGGHRRRGALPASHE